MRNTVLLRSSRSLFRLFGRNRPTGPTKPGFFAHYRDRLISSNEAPTADDSPSSRTPANRRVRRERDQNIIYRMYRQNTQYLYDLSMPAIAVFGQAPVAVRRSRGGRAGRPRQLPKRPTGTPRAATGRPPLHPPDRPPSRWRPRTRRAGSRRTASQPGGDRRAPAVPGPRSARRRPTPPPG